MSDADSDRLTCGIEEYRVWFSPSPGAYAVIRLSPVEMVRDLEDDEALEAARAMQPKSYLVCLDIEMELPIPDKPWYRFEARPIGPHLPSANEEEGYTPDMCIPIYPNTNHPTGRAPIRPRRPFPYGNCYHWIDNTIHIRVRARPEGFDETNAVKISSRTELLIGKLFREDILRARKTAPPSHVASAQAPTHTHPSEPPPPLTHKGDTNNPKTSTDHVPAADGRLLPLEDNDDATSMSSRGSRSSWSARGASRSVEDITDMDIFSGPDEDLDLVPLVDLWPDLINTLKEEDIGSPLELSQEIKTIQGIIQQARIRAYTALNAQASHIGEIDKLESTTSRSTSMRRRLARLSAVCRKLSAPARRLVSHVKRISRIPYILIWP